LLLIAFSARFGALAGRRGPRWFMAAGPAVMAAGTLWLLRVPETSMPWVLTPDAPGSLVPPSDYLTGFFPALATFGAGLTIVVAPLTTCLMQSVPVRNSGVASAVNNAVSRIGPQLAGALIFVVITASFYSGLARRVPGLDASAPEVRARIAPLNPPPADVPADQAAAARRASTEAFHTAMLISAGLLAAGAAVNAIWIRNPATGRRGGSGPE
jgi:hypothetical protein